MITEFEQCLKEPKAHSSRTKTPQEGLNQSVGLPIIPRGHYGNQYLTWLVN